MNQAVIYGSGDLGIQLYYHLRAQDVPVLGFIDDVRPVGSHPELPLDVLGDKNLLKKLNEQKEICGVYLGIGYKHVQFKQELFDWFVENDIKLLGFQHESSFVDPSASLASGVIIYPKGVIDQRVHVEHNVLLNLGVIVSHDSTIGANSFIAPGVVISGFCKIGRNCFIGAGAVLKDQITICDNTTIGAGSIVVNDIVEPGVYFGNPAKFQKL